MNLCISRLDGFFLVTAPKQAVLILFNFPHHKAQATAAGGSGSIQCTYSGIHCLTKLFFSSKLRDGTLGQIPIIIIA